MQINPEDVKTKPLGHLGLVAATIEKLGIINKIDARLSLRQDKGGIVSHGIRVAAMILNGLGFINSRLYMSPMFFHDKPVATLLGEGIESTHLNDDSLGRCLDKIAEYGTTKIFSEVALEIAQERGLLQGSLHIDTTSLLLYGAYTGAETESRDPLPTYGHSKANRPDLKQVVLSMTQMGPAHIPIWMESLDGNSSDKKSFHETVRKIEAFYREIEDAPKNLCFILDSAFYDLEKLKSLPESIQWITRAPSRIKAVKAYEQAPEETFHWQDLEDARYRIARCANSTEATDQRWLLVSSKPAYEREYKTLCKKMGTASEEMRKILWHLGNQYFGCPHDAKKSIAPLLKKQKYFQIEYEIIEESYYTQKGRPKQGDLPTGKRYRIAAWFYSDLQKIETAKNRLGRFMLSTNVLDVNALSDAEILSQYKEQSHIESGFKFIKNDTFELDNIFLKTPRRIGALMMIMTLCLMVYNFAQYDLRGFLKTQDETLPNQVGKPVKNPTIQWVFAIMATIAVVEIYEKDHLSQYFTTNIQPIHKKIIAYFGNAAKKIYGIPIALRPEDIVLNKKIWLKWCGI